MGHKSLNEDPVMIFLYDLTNNKETISTTKKQMMSPQEDAKEYSQLFFPLPECRIQAFGEKKKDGFKAIEIFCK